MKKKYCITLLGALSLALAGCADLGFGVDVDGGAPNPYWYGNGYLGGTYWNTPVWNYGPIYNQTPPPPPFISVNPGPVRPPQTIPQPPQNRPTGGRPGNVNPGTINPGGNQTNNRVPTQVNGIQRPGNGGLPTGDNGR